jgi:hypothetical protein
MRRLARGLIALAMVSVVAAAAGGRESARAQPALALRGPDEERTPS